MTCCYNCNDRHIGCHSACDKYIAEKQSLAKTKQSKRKVTIQEIADKFNVPVELIEIVGGSDDEN